MGLLELCLLSVLSPQQPTPAPAVPGATPTPVQVAPPTAPPTDDERAKLLLAERAGAKADPEALGQLTDSPNDKVATRAGYLLARLNGEPAITVCNRVVVRSPHAVARLQAVNALLRHASISSVAPAIAALEDADRDVRTIAAQLLGKLRRPAAVQPLLALLERTDTSDSATAPTKTGAPKATDVQAALIALHDLDARDHLLRAANALEQRAANGAGDALAWLFQGLSPKLPRADETTLLVAVLGHREAMLRRYAIGRLGVLAEPSTAAALEGRLGTEGSELRPLVEVALSQVRADKTAQVEGLQRVIDSGKALFAKARARWDALSDQGRWIVGASPVALIVVFMLVSRLRRRRANAASAAATMALVAPSEEHIQEMAEEAEALEAAADAEASMEGDAVAAEDDGLVHR